MGRVFWVTDAFPISRPPTDTLKDNLRCLWLGIIYPHQLCLVIYSQSEPVSNKHLRAKGKQMDRGRLHNVVLGSSPPNVIYKSMRKNKREELKRPKNRRIRSQWRPEAHQGKRLETEAAKGSGFHPSLLVAPWGSIIQSSSRVTTLFTTYTANLTAKFRGQEALVPVRVLSGSSGPE